MLKKFNIRKPLPSDGGKGDNVGKKVIFIEKKKQSQTIHSYNLVKLNYFFQDENRTLIDRLMKYKIKDAEKMNDENESFLK